MPTPEQIHVLKFAVAVVAFALGIWSAWGGIRIITAREIGEIDKLRTKLVGTLAPAGAPSFEDLAKLIEAVAKLLAVKTGPGAFLCLFGLVLGIAGWFLLAGI